MMFLALLLSISVACYAQDFTTSLPTTADPKIESENGNLTPRPRFTSVRQVAFNRNGPQRPQPAYQHRPPNAPDNPEYRPQGPIYRSTQRLNVSDQDPPGAIYQNGLVPPPVNPEYHYQGLIHRHRPAVVVEIPDRGSPGVTYQNRRVIAPVNPERRIQGRQPVNPPISENRPTSERRPVYQGRPAVIPDSPEDYSYKPYSFNYISDAEDGMFSREETADGNGRVVGSYMMSLEDGRKRRVDYVADQNGFRANIDTNEPGTATDQNPADIFYSGSPVSRPLNLQSQPPAESSGSVEPESDQVRPVLRANPNWHQTYHTDNHGPVYSTNPYYRRYVPHYYEDGTRYGHWH